MYYWNLSFILYSMNHTCSFKFMTTSTIKGMDSVALHRNGSSGFKLVQILIISLLRVYILVSINTSVYRHTYTHTTFQIKDYFS